MQNIDYFKATGDTFEIEVQDTKGNVQESWRDTMAQSPIDSLNAVILEILNGDLEVRRQKESCNTYNKN